MEFCPECQNKMSLIHKSYNLVLYCPKCAKSIYLRFTKMPNIILPTLSTAIAGKKL